MIIFGIPGAGGAPGGRGAAAAAATALSFWILNEIKSSKLSFESPVLTETSTKMDIDWNWNMMNYKLKFDQEAI